MCIMCEEKQETFEHFMKCNEYGENSQSEWTDIFGNDTEKQKTIAEEVRKRTKMRKRRQEAGQDSTPGSHSPTFVVEI